MTIQSLLQNPDYKQKRVLENLICHFLGLKREELRTSLDLEINENILNKINEAYNDFVIKKKPLEYVLGYVEFLGNQFKIDHRALIPRPETEYMIQAVNEYVTTEKEKFPPDKGGKGGLEVAGNNPPNPPCQGGVSALLDIGTGCGVLGLSILLHNKDFFHQAYLSEYIDDTLLLAQENYEHYKNKLGKTIVTLLKSNLLEFLFPPDKGGKGGFVIAGKGSYLINPPNPPCQGGVSKTPWGENVVLVANLPYIPDQTFDENVGENVKNWEPRPAFVGGKDGLDYYRKMFEQIIEFGIKPIMFLEMMTWQVDILKKEFGDKINFEEVKTFHFNIKIVKAVLR